MSCDIENPCSFKKYVTFLNRLYYINLVWGSLPLSNLFQTRLCKYLKLSLANEYVCDVTISTQVIKYNQCWSRQINQSDCSIHIKVNYSKLIKIIINRFVFFKQVELASRLCKCGVWSRKKSSWYVLCLLNISRCLCHTSRQPYRLLNGYRAHLECPISGVLAPVGSNQILWNWYLRLLPKPHVTKDKEQRLVGSKSG